MKTFLGKYLLFVTKYGPLSPLPGKEIKYFAVRFQVPKVWIGTFLSPQKS
jgi:hypothetical protein